MAEYHVGCGAFGIYAGTLNTQKTMWKNKSEVTDECISAAAQYLLEQDQSMIFNYKGNKYRLQVIKEDNEEIDS